MSVSVEQISTAADNFISDTETANAKINGSPAMVTDRHGSVTENLQLIFQRLGYYVPVSFEAGLTVSSGAFTVEHEGSVYAALPTQTPFTTTASFDPLQWRLAPGASLQITTPASFGAAGDGVTDDTAAVRDALLFGGVIDGMGKTYRVTSAVNIPVSAIPSGVQIDNFTLDVSAMPDQGGSPDVALSFSGEQGPSVPLSQNLLANTSTISVGVGNTAGFSEDQEVWLQSDAIFEVSQSVVLGHLAKIAEVDAAAGTLTLHTSALYDFLTADNATVSALTLLPHMIFGKGFKVKGARANNQLGVRLHLCGNPVLENGVSIEDCDYAGFTFSRCYGGSIHHPRIVRAESTGLSYGVTVGNGCRGLVFSGGFGEDLRHFITGGDNEGVNVFITVTASYVSGALDAGLDCHGAGDFWTFSSNTIVGSHTSSGQHDGLIMQGNNVVMTGNILKGFRRHSVFHQPLPVIGDASAVIVGNTIHDSGGSPSSEAAISVSVSNKHLSALVISDNTWLGDSSSEYFIYLRLSDYDVNRFVVSGNVMAETCDASVAALRVHTIGSAKVNAFSVVANIFSAVSGQVVYFDGRGGALSNGVFSGNVLASEVAGVEGLRLTNVHNFTETGNTFALNPASRNYFISESTCEGLSLDTCHTKERLSTAPTLTVDPDENFITVNEIGDTEVTLPAASSYQGRILHFSQSRSDGVVFSDAANVVPLTVPTVAGSAILPAVDGAWCQMRSSGLFWKIIAQGA